MSSSYDPTEWVDGQDLDGDGIAETPTNPGDPQLNAENLNKLEQGVVDAHDRLDGISLGSGATFEYTLASAINAGDTTFTLDRAPSGAALGTGWFVIEPYSTNCEIRRVTSIAGAVVTPTIGASMTLTASNISFTAATKKITGSVGAISKFFPEQTIIITGSASNNGTYTVASLPTDGTYDGTYITVNESLVNESAGASVTVKVTLRAHAAGSRVIFTQGPTPVTWYGAKASASTSNASTNRLAFQRMFDDSYYAQNWDLYVPGFMAGRYYIDAPLYMDKQVMFRSPNQKSGVIAAHSTFQCWNEDVAMLITRRNGQTTRMSNGPNDRYYIQGIGLDAANVAYAKSTGYDGSSSKGTAFAHTGTNTVTIHATLRTPSDYIVYRAVAEGTAGNSITVAHVNDGASQPLTVSVASNAITVHLATNGSSVVTSTVAQVVAAVNGDVSASALVSASLWPYNAGIGGSTALAVVMSATSLLAGTAPFSSGDVGRSISLGMKTGGARTIATYVSATEVTVSGAAFSSDRPGLRFAVSGVNGFIGAFNQTAIIKDMRIESCPGYAFAATGCQEFTVENMMTLFSGIHRRLRGVQFAHFKDCNMEHSCDAYVTYETDSNNSINRSNYHIGGHIEDIEACDYFRVESTGTYPWTGHEISTYQSTSNSDSVVIDNGFTGYASSFTVTNWEWSGPNSGPIFLIDRYRNITIPMTSYALGNDFSVPFFSIGSEMITQRNIQSKTTTYQMLITDKLVKADATGGAFTVTLPSAVSMAGLVCTVKRMNGGGNAVSVDQNGSETIDGSTSAVSLAAQYDRITVMSDGSNWQRID